MVRTSERPKKTDPSEVEVGEIDTSAPFQSVKDAVSLFGKVAFSGEKPSIKKASPLSAEKVLAKESRLHMAQKELDKLKEQLQNAENTKAEALAELEKAKRTVEQLSEKLKVLTESKEAAVQATEAAKKQAKLLEEANSENPAITNGFHKDNSENGTEEYANVLSELNAAKQELAKVRQDYDSVLEAKAIATKQVEAAEHAANINADRADNFSKKIATLKEMIEQVEQKSAGAQQERAKISAEDPERLSYKARLQESEQKLQMMRKQCDPEVAKTLESQLAEAMSHIEGLRKEVESAKASDMDSVKTVTSSLDSAKESLQKLLEEESSLQSLVSSLKEDLENLQKEHAALKEKELEVESFAGNLNVELQKCKSELEAALSGEAKANMDISDMTQTLNQLTLETETARRESQEMKLEAEELRREAAATRESLVEAERRLEAVLLEVEEAKAAESRAVDRVKAHSERAVDRVKARSSMDGKISISREEFEALKRKAEGESGRLAEMKAAAAGAQAEAVRASEREAIQKIEAAEKEAEEMKAATEAALKKAAMAEAAKQAVEGELRRWREREQKKAAEAGARILAEVGAPQQAGRVVQKTQVMSSRTQVMSSRSGPIDYEMMQKSQLEKGGGGGHKKLEKLKTSVPTTKVMLPSISGMFQKKRNQADVGSPSYLPGEI